MASVTSNSSTALRKLEALPLEKRALLIESMEGQRGFYPALGVCGSILGTVLAPVMVPADPGEQGALRNSAIALAIGFLVAPVVAGLINPRNFLRTENIIGMTPIYWLLLDLIQGVYGMRGVSREAVNTTFCVIGGATACFWFGTAGKPWTLPKSFIRSCSLKPSVWVLFGVIVFCFSVAMLTFAIPCKFDVSLMIKYLGAARWSAPWARGAMGNWDSFRDHLSYFGYLVPALATMLARRHGWTRLLSILGLLMAVTFILFLAQGGSRRLVGTCLGAALCYWVLDRPKVKILQVIAAGAAVMGILWVMQVMIVSRGEGFGSVGKEAVYIATKSVEFEKVGIRQFESLRVDDNFYRMVNIATTIPALHDYVYFDYIYYVLLRPIPRAFWEGKPIDPGYAVTLLSTEGTQLSCTVLGELYMSGGWVAIALGGWLLGRLARLNYVLFYSASGSMAPLFYAYMTMWLFAGYRGMIDLVLFTYPLLAWMGISWLLGRQLQGAK